MTAGAAQLRLVDLPLCGVYPIALADANALLERWEHKLGPVWRPFRSEAYALELDAGHGPIAVAISASIVNGPVAGYERGEVVELVRLGSSERWANRVMLRLWREVCAPRWACWPVKAAVSYSHNAMHSGDLYRFDGWTKEREDCGSSGGGTWGRQRHNTDAVYGKKTLWVWPYTEGGP